MESKTGGVRSTYQRTIRQQQKRNTNRNIQAQPLALWKFFLFSTIISLTSHKITIIILIIIIIITIIKIIIMITIIIITTIIMMMIIIIILIIKINGRKEEGSGGKGEGGGKYLI